MRPRKQLNRFRQCQPGDDDVLVQMPLGSARKSTHKKKTGAKTGAKRRSVSRSKNETENKVTFSVRSVNL